MPNITGGFFPASGTNGVGSWLGVANTYGAFKKGTATASNTANNLGGSSTANRTEFDASLSSSTYGSSETVTPLSQSTLWCMKY